MSTQPIKGVVRCVKPILSTTPEDAKRKVLNLYKAWYREAPEIILKYRTPMPIKAIREKIREEFMKHKDVKDIRVIDLLVFKGQNELKETVKVWKQTSHVLYNFKLSEVEKPTNFVAKFLAGYN